MNPPVKVRCDVCFEAYSLEMFRFLPSCGHGLCIVCSEKTQQKRNCAICRHPKGPQEPIQIYLTLADPVDKAHSVVDSLARIGPDSLPISVQKAGRKIRKVVRDVEPEDDVMKELLAAAKNLDERVFPLFMDLDLANDKIANLTCEIDTLRAQLKAAEAKDDDIKQLQSSLADSRAETRAHLATAEKNKGVALKERAENAKLGRAVTRHLSELSEKQEENAVLRAKLTRRDTRISLLEKKLKVVSRTKQPLKGDKSNDPDESLQVENSAEGIRISRKSNDWVEPARKIRKPPRGGHFSEGTMPDIEL
ncbi:hypothetical protein FB45DRAFT_315057 [Roridomyces roridus]|uniref:RING-type domain-containing protein n=1 Tax=Roridomyces roridus TaxID=1738132 RepID=A0AAD7B636_9AGAR|nr:hypothetical protein FB45DRAFT_315057 [Roridomyces roridus]